MNRAYPCDIVSYESQGEGFLVTFPDIPEAITGDMIRDEALVLAEDAMLVALSIYLDNDEDLPTPSALADGQVLITIPPLQSAKLALYTEMRERGVSQSDLADALGVGESDIRDLLDLDWDSTPAQVAAAREAVKAGAKSTVRVLA